VAGELDDALIGIDGAADDVAPGVVGEGAEHAVEVRRRDLHNTTIRLYLCRCQDRRRGRTLIYVAELALAVVIVIAGGALTTIGAFAHGGPLIAPGSALLLFGGAWLGNVLARRDIRLFPAPATARDEAE
jgi:hypothetical protein